MTVSLDIHANNASPPVSNQNSQVGNLSEKKDQKYRRHALRRSSSALMRQERVSCCGQKTIGGFASLHHHQGQSHFGSVETCGSVWMCPVCAAKITQGRLTELDALLDSHRLVSGHAYMATLTIPHHRFQSCAELKQAVANAWRKVKTGKGWQTARDSNLWIGDIRALEITHGDNGWHPHLHILVFFDHHATDGQMLEFGEWLFETWAKSVERNGFGRCSRNAFRYDRVNDAKGAAEYVGKWGVAMEMTKAHVKRSKNGRTPWQILTDYNETGDERDAGLFQEYAIAFKGARQLTWSRAFKRRNLSEIPSIRKRYLEGEELSDQELSEEPTMKETQTAFITRDLFKTISGKAMTADVLSAQERGGLDEVLTLLSNRGVLWKITEVPGLLEGTFVPMLSPRTSRGCSPEVFPKPT
ncbi:protein rep [Kiloniella antarctica]|uniref:Protein rep n=1 Tax=Kiloniella antarctica TaxID=1550907 RepID=A0ABW5BGV4_9PROT